MENLIFAGYIESKTGRREQRIIYLMFLCLVNGSVAVSGLKLPNPKFLTLIEFKAV